MNLRSSIRQGWVTASTECPVLTARPVQAPLPCHSVKGRPSTQHQADDIRLCIMKRENLFCNMIQIFLHLLQHSFHNNHSWTSESLVNHFRQMPHFTTKKGGRGPSPRHWLALPGTSFPDIAGRRMEQPAEGLAEPTALEFGLQS